VSKRDLLKVLEVLSNVNGGHDLEIKGKWRITMKRTYLIFGVLAISAFALSFAVNLKLRPGTVGPGSDAYWTSTPNHMLVLRKNVPTSEWDAAGADINGVAGKPVATLAGLSWKLISGAAGGGSPRWNLYYGPVGGSWEGYKFLEPASYDGNGVGSMTGAEILANPNWVNRDILPGDEIKYLQVIVDEQEEIVLDDITVELDGESTVFSGPGKSG
jgi:hypothetical protein